MKLLEIARSYYPSVGGLEKFISDRLKIYKSLGFDYRIYTEDKSEYWGLPRTAFTLISQQKNLTEEDQQAIDRVKELNKQGLVDIDIK